MSEEERRRVLVDVLVYHWRDGITGCGCGWEHVAGVYFDSLRARSS